MAYLLFKMPYYIFMTLSSDYNLKSLLTFRYPAVIAIIEIDVQLLLRNSRISWEELAIKADFCFAKQIFFCRFWCLDIKKVHGVTPWLSYTFPSNWISHYLKPLSKGF